MGGKGGGSPAAPDYTPIANADAQAATMETQLGQQQLDWGKQQFNEVWPFAQNYLQGQADTATAEAGQAAQQQKMYDTFYAPNEASFAGTAMGYNSPARADQNAGAAMGDVSNAFDANRASALSNLESYGIDPSQTRYGALDLSTRISQAAATAAAGTQSRLNTQATGLALQGEAINIGRGYPSSIAQSYNTATNAGASGINTANNTLGTGSGLMGSPTQYMGLANGSRAGQVSALNTGFQNSLGSAQFASQQQGNTMSGIGSLIGGAAAAAALFV